MHNQVLDSSSLACYNSSNGSSGISSKPPPLAYECIAVLVLLLASKALNDVKRNELFHCPYIIRTLWFGFSSFPPSLSCLSLSFFLFSGAHIRVYGYICVLYSSMDVYTYIVDQKLPPPPRNLIVRSISKGAYKKG